MDSYFRSILDGWFRWASCNVLSNCCSNVDTTVGIVLKLSHVWNVWIGSLVLVSVVHSTLFNISSTLCVHANIFQIKLVGCIIVHLLTGPLILNIKTGANTLAWCRHMTLIVWPLLGRAAASQPQVHLFTWCIQNFFHIILVWLSNAFIYQIHVRVIFQVLISRMRSLRWWTLNVLRYPRFNIVRWFLVLGYNFWLDLGNTRGRLISINLAWYSRNLRNKSWVSFLSLSTLVWFFFIYRFFFR